MRWVCSNCGADAYFDGRCGDGPVLICRCRNGEYINDGRGGYTLPINNARPIQTSDGMGSNDEHCNMLRD